MTKMKRVKQVLLLTGALMLFSACSVEPGKSVPEEYKTGQAYFHKVCANCHGPDGQGGNKAPDLMQEKFVKENFPDYKFFRTILNGSSSGAMPSQKNRVKKDQIREIIQYIRYSQKQEGAIS